MRDKVNVFYYPNMVADNATLKRAVLLFDELHFIDRPSFMFGHFGTIATPSPLRSYEKSFRDNGIPLYVHPPRDGPVQGDFLQQITNDVNDTEFLRKFQDGLSKSLIFRNHQIGPGNYGEVGNENDVVRELRKVDLDTAFAGYPTPMDLFSDKGVQHFRFSTDVERAKGLVTQALTCSAMLNFALIVSQQQGMTPMADAKPYQDLLGAKYARAAGQLTKSDATIQLTDLSFEIFDELVPAERIEVLTYKQIIDYRKESAKAREAFLEHLVALRAKQGSIGDVDYSAAISNVVASEIIPAAREFRGRLEGIYDRLFGKIAASVLGYLGGSAGLQIFGDLSWLKLLELAGVAGGTLAGTAIEARQSMKAAKRECAISYVLGLDK